MNTLLLLSLSLSAPPAELPISARAEMAVKQATARITQQNTPVRAPTSSLLVPNQATPSLSRLIQPTGVSYSPFVYPPVQQSGGITQGTIVRIVEGQNTITPAVVQVQPTRIRAVFAEQRGITSGCST